MGYMDVMQNLGAVPKGATPNVIPNRNTEMLQKTLKKILTEKEDQIKKSQEKKKNKFDMYKTLRESGYDSFRAWKAVQEGAEMPEPPEKTEDTTFKKGTGFTQEQKTKRRIGKQHNIQRIQQWGRTGQAPDDTGIMQDIDKVEDLVSMLISDPEMGPNLDLEDNQTMQALDAAAKQRGIKLPKDETEKKNWWQKIFSKKEESVSEFSTSEEAQAAGDAGKLKDGTVITVNGKRFKWVN